MIQIDQLNRNSSPLRIDAAKTRTMAATINAHRMSPDEMHPAVMKRRRSLRLLNEQIEAKVVSNIGMAVKDYAAGLTRDAKFLNETQIEVPVALFHSSEIAVGQLLGKGGFSQVFEARSFNLLETLPCSGSEDISLARRIVESTAVNHRGQANYAIKHLDKRLLDNPDEFCAAAADLYVEAKYMSRFNHPNILKLRGLANGGAHAFCDGRYNSFFILTDRLVLTLDQRIERWGRDGAPRTDMIALKSNYALQIAFALEYLHERQIIFRDLKPQNVGFKEDDTVQLFDFGLCRELPDSQGFPDETFKMSEAGTRRFMAPEIYLGARYNLKADVYSWAITTYELLSHERAYSKLSDVEFQSLVLGQGLRPKLYPYHLPHKLEFIIQKAWTHNLSQRFSMSQVRQHLQFIVDEWEQRSAHIAPSISPATVAEERPLFPSSGHFGCELYVEHEEEPVFTFEEDLVNFGKHTAQNATSAQITLTTLASTEMEDQSITTFDCSLSSLMDLEEDLTASQAIDTALSMHEAFNIY